MTEPVADIISLKLYRAKREKQQLVDPVVVWWRCREFSCVAKVGITQTALDALAIFQAELGRRHDKPIREDEVGWCCEAHRGENKQRSNWR